jgi:hypothetical protein
MVSLSDQKYFLNLFSHQCEFLRLQQYLSREGLAEFCYLSLLVVQGKEPSCEYLLLLNRITPVLWHRCYKVTSLVPNLVFQGGHQYLPKK